MINYMQLSELIILVFYKLLKFYAIAWVVSVILLLELWAVLELRRSINEIKKNGDAE